MKKLLVTLCFMCALAIAAHAEDKAEGAKPEAAKPAAKKTVTAEQKSFRKELKDKYDANKDGKLDADEKAKISNEDWEKAGYAPRKEKKEKKAA